MKRNQLLALTCLSIASTIALVLMRPAPLRPPTNQHLQEALEGTTRIVVRAGGTCHRSQEREPVQAKVTAQKEIEELIAGLEVDEKDGGFHCMCCGNPTLEFYKGKNLKAALGYHHARSFRWSEWDSDVMLTPRSQEAVLTWLDARGVTGPRKELEASLERKKVEDQQRVKWVEAMPAALRESWNFREAWYEEKSAAKLHKVLESAVTNEVDRILVLLEWFGSGTGSWIRSPFYENVPKEMLFEYSSEQIVSACDGRELSERQKEGLSRFWTEIDFRARRSNDLKGIPEPLKKVLLDHSLKGTNDYNKERAIEALSPITN